MLNVCVIILSCLKDDNDWQYREPLSLFHIIVTLPFSQPSTTKCFLAGQNVYERRNVATNVLFGEEDVR